ncbi:hypothetical protein [Macrococcoides caseolyticum]|nr:hypothetical protein [Macrococcus caseolyticus]
MQYVHVYKVPENIFWHEPIADVEKIASNIIAVENFNASPKRV